MTPTKIATSIVERKIQARRAIKLAMSPVKLAHQAVIPGSPASATGTGGGMWDDLVGRMQRGELATTPGEPQQEAQAWAGLQKQWAAQNAPEASIDWSKDPAGARRMARAHAGLRQLPAPVQIDLSDRNEPAWRAAPAPKARPAAPPPPPPSPGPPTLWDDSKANAKRVGYGILGSLGGGLGIAGVGIPAAAANTWNYFAPDSADISKPTMDFWNNSFNQMVDFTNTRAADVYHGLPFPTISKDNHYVHPAFRDQTARQDYHKSLGENEYDRALSTVDPTTAAASRAFKQVGERAAEQAAHALTGRLAFSGLSRVPGATQLGTAYSTHVPQAVQKTIGYGTGIGSGNLNPYGVATSFGLQGAAGEALRQYDEAHDTNYQNALPINWTTTALQPVVGEEFADPIAQSLMLGSIPPTANPLPMGLGILANESVTAAGEHLFPEQLGLPPSAPAAAQPAGKNPAASSPEISPPPAADPETQFNELVSNNAPPEKMRAFLEEQKQLFLQNASPEEAAQISQQMDAIAAEYEGQFQQQAPPAESQPADSAQAPATAVPQQPVASGPQQPAPEQSAAQPVEPQEDAPFNQEEFDKMIEGMPHVAKATYASQEARAQLYADAITSWRNIKENPNAPAAISNPAGPEAEKIRADAQETHAPAVAADFTAAKPPPVTPIERGNWFRDLFEHISTSWEKMGPLGQLAFGLGVPIGVIGLLSGNLGGFLAGAVGLGVGGLAAAHGGMLGDQAQQMVGNLTGGRDQLFQMTPTDMRDYIDTTFAAPKTDAETKPSAGFEQPVDLNNIPSEAEEQAIRTVAQTGLLNLQNVLMPKDPKKSVLPVLQTLISPEKHDRVAAVFDSLSPEDRKRGLSNLNAMAPRLPSALSSQKDKETGKPKYSAEEITQMQENLKQLIRKLSGQKTAQDNYVNKVLMPKIARCWKGYEPVPGSKPYTEGSCRPKGSKKTQKQMKKKSDASILSIIRGYYGKQANTQSIEVRAQGNTQTGAQGKT